MQPENMIDRNEKGQFVKGRDGHQPFKMYSDEEINKKQDRVCGVAIKTDVQNKLREMLLKSDGSGLTYYEDFLNNFLEMARRDPTSKAAEIVAKTCLHEDLLEQLDKTLEQSMMRNMDFVRFRIMKSLFDRQRDILFDNEVKRKCIICSRRAGKTEMAIRQLLYTAVTPKSPMFYIGLTDERAKRQIWGANADITEIAEQVGLAITKTNRTDGYIEFANGSSLQITGNNNQDAIEKLRGFKARLVIIDECQSQKNLQYLVDEIISPLLTDYEDSILILQGTPPRSPHHTFEETFYAYRDGNNPRNKAYHWTMRENPFIPDITENLQDILQTRGLTMDSPFIQREYLGNVGVYDTEAQVFAGYQSFKSSCINDDLSAPRINIDDIPRGFVPNRIYIGNDYGWAACNAVIGLAADTVHRECWVFYEHKFSKASVSDIVASNKTCLELGKKLLMRNTKQSLNNIAIYGDTSDNSILYEMSVNHGLPAYKCYKYDKDMAITQLAEELRTGRIMIPSGGVLSMECDRTVYERDDFDVIQNKIDDDVFHPDAMMALLYASRQYLFDIGCSLGGDAAKI